MKGNAFACLQTIVSLLLYSKTVNSHVALTYPPARKYDLDFLDNSRTKGPCGMPKGSIKTSLLAGSAFNITWHLAYPHRGGFKLQVLDNLERPVLDLTPVTANSDFVTDDVTAQSYSVQLPQDFSCEDCTIRLLRQASEWSSSYRFWSCADVDIKKRREFKEDCSGHGRYLLSKCRCDRLYYGSRCQYRDECIDDADCGDHGRCVDVEATTAPRKQCYCELGWFGPACTKKSAVRSTDIDFDWYSKRELNKDFHLHWRILKEEEEIEIILVVNGTGYAGIGWRPFNITPACKNFPEIIDKSFKAKFTKESEANGEVVAEQKAEPEPNSEPSTTTEPEPNPETEPEVTTSNGRPKLHQRRQKSVSSRATKAGESLTTKESVETSVSYRITASRGKRETDENEEGASEPEPKGSESPSRFAGNKGKYFRGKNSEQSNENVNPKVSLDPSHAKSEPEPEPTNEPDAKSEPESRSDADSEPKSSDLLPSSEPTSEPELTAANEKYHGKPGNAKTKKNDNSGKSDSSFALNPYTPRHDFNSMDCTDIIIGMAKGTYSRILDYYTRDRSTPRLDTFWGGRNDITTAMGFEKDGKTTILFRKKLLAQEPSDHSIGDATMHVIWAKGQEMGRYKHFPKSGLEKDYASVKDFYKPDELKYHGHGDQRGQISINFFDEHKSGLIRKEEDHQKKFCGGSWRSPRSCDQKKHDCEYYAKWEYFSKKDEVKFEIETTHINTWTGIAFSNDRKMSHTDAIIGWVDKNGRSFLMDTWINGYNTPLLDEQNIYNSTGRIIDGVTSISFVRKRSTLDSKDIQFNDKECFYFQYPVHGGAFNAVNKKIKRHEQIPFISGERICIRSCNFDADSDDEPAASSKLAYSLQIKVTNLSKNITSSSSASSKWKMLSTQIISNLNEVLKHLPGLDKITVSNILKSEENAAIAKLNIIFDRSSFEKGRALKDENQLKSIIKETVEIGKLGALNVDPKYFVFEAQPLTSSVPVLNGSDSQWFSTTKLYVVIGCLIALIMIAVIQASCTIYKTTVTKSSSGHKERLIPSSAWKDYSAVNTNYAFEPYEAEEKSSGTKASILPITKSQGPLCGSPGNMRPNHTNNGLVDTKSLHRMHGNNRFGNTPPERSTYSLPRTSQPSNTHYQGYYTHRPHSELQPDFYFMPSQRKYSGEVVRVYVDYNNVSKK